MCESDEAFYSSRQCYTTAISAMQDFYIGPLPDFLYRDDIREAAMRHDLLARKKYYKPFKSFKFNRARRQRP